MPKAPACWAARASASCRCFVALHAIAAQLMNALRTQAAVGHHRYARRDQPRNHFGLLHAALQFHGLTAGLLQDPARASDRPIHAQMKTGKRHIDHQQGMMHGTPHHLGVIDHLLQRHGQRVGMALHDHREAVAHQNALDAGRIDQFRRGIVVGGQHGDLPPGGFHRRELGNRDGMLLGIHISHEDPSSEGHPPQNAPAAPLLGPIVNRPAPHG